MAGSGNINTFFWSPVNSQKRGSAPPHYGYLHQKAALSTHCPEPIGKLGVDLSLMRKTPERPSFAYWTVTESRNDLIHRHRWAEAKTAPDSSKRPWDFSREASLPLFSFPQREYAVSGCFLSIRPLNFSPHFVTSVTKTRIPKVLLCQNWSLNTLSRVLLHTSFFFNLFRCHKAPDSKLYQINK